MNFQAARNLEGQKDASGYQAGVSMTGTIMGIEEKKFTEKGKPFQQISLKDSLGETQKVKIWLGGGPDILVSDVGTQQSFSSLAVNPFKGKVYYKAFWDSMHPPQGQPLASHLTPATQAIIDQHRQPTPQQAATAIQDRMAGTSTDSQKMQRQPVNPTQQDYQAKEREKVLGMCFTNLLSGRLSNTPAVEIEQDLGEIAAIWRLAAMCIDGTGRVQEEPNF